MKDNGKSWLVRLGCLGGVMGSILIPRSWSRVMGEYISFDAKVFNEEILIVAKKALRDAQKLLMQEIKSYPLKKSGAAGRSGEYKRSTKILEIMDNIATLQNLSGIVEIGGEKAWWAYWVEEGTGGKSPRGGPWMAPGKLPDRGFMPSGQPWPLGPDWSGGGNFLQFPGPNREVVRRWNVRGNPAQHVMANALQMSISPIARIVSDYFNAELGLIIKKSLKVVQ
jgi:hypothetical protein